MLIFETRFFPKGSTISVSVWAPDMRSSSKQIHLQLLFLHFPCAESSDDSYISAGEDPLEAPIFEIPIQDVTVIAGTEVLFKCIITGNPSPEGKWMEYCTGQNMGDC